jgi:dTMP kinase
MIGRPLFITFEGIDGCGKTTQLRLLARHLRGAVETVEPGGTDIGNQVRRILLDPESRAMTARAELLLYFASRAQNVAEVIRPALQAGKTVLCDRFTDSTLAYQGWGRGLDCDMIRTLDRIACEGLKPDITILIDIDLETSIARARERNLRFSAIETRMDEESLEFFRRVREGYHALADSEPERFIVVDGKAKIGVVAKTIWNEVLKRV